MVILFVLPFYEKKGDRPTGGLNMYIRRVTRVLKESGHQPIIMSYGLKDEHYMENGIEVYSVKRPQIHLRDSNLELLINILYGSVRINRKIVKLSKERKIDIIQFASVWGVGACYFGQVPTVMRLSIYSKVYRNYSDDKTKTDIYALVERLAARRCNAIFAPSNVIAKAFSRDINRKVSVIETLFWNENEVCDDSIYSKMLSGKKYFLYYGRLSVDKGLLVIAESLRSFLKANQEYFFVCCGIEVTINGENAANILKKAVGEYRNRFIYMKSIPHNYLYPIIQHADFVIAPSLVDNFPNACMEAMYFKRVVIGSNGASHEQLIEDGKSGLLCVPGNVESLLKKMNEAVTMSDVQKTKIGENARKRVEKLKPEIVVNKLLRYYQYIIDNVNK